MTAIAAAGGRVWTAGGEPAAATLRQWSAQGQADCFVELGAIGARTRLPTCAWHLRRPS